MKYYENTSVHRTSGGIKGQTIDEYEEQKIIVEAESSIKFQYISQNKKFIIPAQNFHGWIKKEEIHLYKSVLKKYSYINPKNVFVPKSGEYFLIKQSGEIKIISKPEDIRCHGFLCICVVVTKKVTTILYEEWERYWDKN